LASAAGRSVPNRPPPLPLLLLLRVGKVVLITFAEEGGYVFTSVCLSVRLSVG